MNDKTKIASAIREQAMSENILACRYCHAPFLSDQNICICCSRPLHDEDDEQPKQDAGHIADANGKAERGRADLAHEHCVCGGDQACEYHAKMMVDNILAIEKNMAEHKAREKVERRIAEYREQRKTDLLRELQTARKYIESQRRVAELEAERDRLDQDGEMFQCDIASALGWSAEFNGMKFTDAVRTLRADRDRLRLALIEQKEIWELAKPDLDDIDRRRCNMPFMDFHGPIVKINRALAGEELK